MEKKYQPIDDGSGMTKSQMERSEFIVRKSEKLTTAVYMVSDIIPDREPVKWKMRETSIELLSDITLSATASSAERLAYLRGVVKKIEKMVSFLDVAWTTRILSEMNASILREEFLALRELVDAEIRELLAGRVERTSIPPMYPIRQKRGDVVSAGRDAARTQEVPRGRNPDSHSAPLPVSPVSSARSSSGAPVSHSAVPGTPDLSPPSTTPPRYSPPSAAPAQHSPHYGQEHENRINKDDRRKIILALLKQRSKLTVKDIAKSIPGFSEKTIQRELLSMLADGQVLKEGEKRWTTYSLRGG